MFIVACFCMTEFRSSGVLCKTNLPSSSKHKHPQTQIISNSTVLYDTATAEPSAELTGAEGDQKDEVDMGMSYAELGELGFARKCERAGPYSTFEKLLQIWNEYQMQICLGLEGSELVMRVSDPTKVCDA